MIGSRIGSYAVVSELGSGGMGKVYLAEVEGKAPGLDGGTRVALKVIHPHLLETPGFFKRFLREAEIGRSVEQGNVVRCFDCDQLVVDGAHQNFLVMEYVEDQTLRDPLKELEALAAVLGRGGGVRYPVVRPAEAGHSASTAIHLTSRRRRRRRSWNRQRCCRRSGRREDAVCSAGQAPCGWAVCAEGGGKMSWVRSIAVAVCMLLGVLGAGSLAHGDVPELDDAARRSRTSKLEQRAREWLKLNTEMLRKCEGCGGAGRVRQRGGRHPGEPKTCSRCKGAKYLVDGPTYMRVKYSYYSPAYRAQEGIEDELSAQWRRYVPYGGTWPGLSGSTFMERFEIVESTLVDSTHGVVQAWIDKHLENPSKPQEFRWIWATEKPGGTGHWYVYDSGVDGRWPQLGALEPYSGAQDLGETALAKLGEDWPVDARHRLTHAHRRDKEIVLTVTAAEECDHRALRSALAAEAFALSARAFDHSKRWERVVIVAAATWRNELGETDVKPYVVLEITRLEFARLRPENLSAQELLRAYDEKGMTHDGWKPWE